MVDNKKKIVYGVAAVATLAGAFVAPETAEAAKNNKSSSPKKNATTRNNKQEKSEKASRKVKSAQAKLKNVEADSQKKVNKAKNSAKKAQERASQAKERAKQAKEDVNTKTISASKLAKKADDTGSKRHRERANQEKQQLEKANQNLAMKEQEMAQTKKEVEKQQDNVKLVVSQTSNEVEAAETELNQAQVELQNTIQGNTKSRNDDNWGNWTKQHTVEDYLTDQSGFQALIPQFQKLVQKERKEILKSDIKIRELDANKLFLKHDHNVRVHFINEGAGYKNQLAYEATKGNDYEKGMIFDNISCKSKDCELKNSNGPLEIGDFVDLGLIQGGTQLNFLLKANGYNNSNGLVYGADESLNNDGLQHLMAFEVNAGGRDYLLMGFEDLVRGEGGNSDEDFNDAMFVVDFGEGNLTDRPGKPTFAQAAKVPEASNMAAIFGVTGAGLMLRRRKKK